MSKATKFLTLAGHKNPTAYWQSGHYELNLSFDLLRDKQWQRIMQTIWEQPALHGPFDERYTPGEPIPEQIPVQTPPPTAAMTQHGLLKVGEAIVGCDIQATRSLFECVSLLVPIAMFRDLTASANLRQEHPELQTLDDLFYDIALHVYDAMPFKIAAIGYERECQLPSELRNDAQARHAFLVSGNFLAQEDVLASLEPDLSRYQQVRANLRWLAPTTLT